MTKIEALNVACRRHTPLGDLETKGYNFFEFKDFSIGKRRVLPTNIGFTKYGFKATHTAGVEYWIDMEGGMTFIEKDH